jgi:Spy/CpxP family protein refolding chaperone
LSNGERTESEFQQFSEEAAMKTTLKHVESLFGIGSLLLLLIIAGCSKNNSPVQSKSADVADYQFNDVISYTELTPSEVSQFVGLEPMQMERVRSAIAQLGMALMEDYKSDDLPSGFGVDRYASLISRINGECSPAQREAFGRLVAFHIDLIGFGHELRHFLRRLAHALELTPEQVDQVKGFARAYADSAREVFRQVRAGELTRQDARAQLGRLRENFIGAFKSILTPAQLEKLDEILNRHRDR